MSKLRQKNNPKLNSSPTFFALPGPESFTAIIVAGGTGTRMATEMPKQFIDLGGKPVVRHCLETFSRLDICESIVLVLPGDRIEQGRDLLADFAPGKPFTIVSGGARRQDSVEAALSAISLPDAWVAVHDAARPLIPAAVIENAFLMARRLGNAVVAMPVVDTLVIADKTGRVTDNLDRTHIRSIQTPQIFPLSILRRAIENARAENVFGTDDAGLVRQLGITIHLTPGSMRNIKLTTADDLRILMSMIS
ncbi:MAG: 2-C-methyl-D-erythritol 4-phosphate cytidylyltransferase [Candidatus Riflebacteria bacterium]|nr:2-C-methyl-D-erythritol 4-phosphate cytidylyltransferase [Candidatus Riflebacteria bacterium]